MSLNLIASERKYRLIDKTLKRLFQFFSPKFLKGYIMDQWLWITGMPRSGTTLIQRITTAHPDITVLCETNIATAFKEVLLNHHSGECDGLHYLSKLGLDISQQTKDIIEACRKWFGDNIYFGDKSTYYIYKYYDINEIFTNSKWIITSRDKEETIASFNRCWGYSREESIFIIDNYNIFYEKIKNDKNILFLEHDKINKYPEETIKNIFNYLELECPSEVFDYSVDLIVNGNINRSIMSFKAPVV